ncbi:hypothetical protein BDY21DRAFT_298782 [Lineolata rhizophorae]|uniref:Armadillo-like helical domain-containing protein n=1 Tax=Lineolata rhizophorae TaxID=578093 RepID=A0A6A6P9M5_9PEZI|nr:hypothetical protein BDY21DRAFT_298782 [Lineolata rhizophorae]
MEASPLVQQTRPESFRPKVVQLYEALLAEEDAEDVDLPEGFWRELFLLRPDPQSLRKLLDSCSPDDLLQLQPHTQQLFLRATQCVRQGVGPSDEVALDTLTAFLAGVLAKRYTNPSSDVISVLAGLHDADSVFYEFVGALDSTIRNGRYVQVRRKAVRVALSMISGAYQTGLISYFTHRDLFPSLMKFVQDADSEGLLKEPIILLGLLANYNKFEFQNPYRVRLDDFVNEVAIRKIITCVGTMCTTARDEYVAVQDDLPEGWNLSSTLTYIGLGSFTSNSRPTTPTASAEDPKSSFAALPGPDAAVLLPAYDFVNANKLFCFNFVSMPPKEKNEPSPFSSFLSLTSYLFQHAHRSARTQLYTHLCLFILHIIVEDQALLKRICGDDSKIYVRLCRQRQPYLPLVRADRVLAAQILDVMLDGLNHNLRRRLDVQFYSLCIGVVMRITSFLHHTRVRLPYHWSEMWRSLLSFIKFLTTYSADLKPVLGISDMISQLVNLIAFSLSNGESFLPDSAAYDDLFYKLVEAGDILTKFRDVYDLSKDQSASSIETLISVSSHYYGLLEENRQSGKSKSKNLSPKEVSNVIKQGYDTLSIEAKDGLDRWDKFREADHKSFVKRLARLAVEDTKILIQSS